jgi:hypothetical protein
MLSTGAPSLSIYRGLSRRGRGEGPGRPITHGEQYLLGTADEIFNRGELLDQARPWLTLDLDPEDQRRIGPRLEAWSYFTVERWRCVASLTLAGVYDQRSAYFAHGRAWPAEAFEGEFDPGAHLGRSEAFDPPFRDGAQAEGRPAPRPVPVRFEQVRAEPETAVALLAALYEGLRRGAPVVMAAPLADFVTGGALPALVSFARAALPLELKRDCRIRVYTRRPEVFLERLRADLIVVPQELAQRAAVARREALLLDRAGARLLGPPPEARTAAYAKAVVARALDRPQSLLGFSARAQVVLGGEPPEDVRLVRLAYYVSAALAGDAAMRAGLCAHFAEVARVGAPLPWPRIVAPREWAAFPRPARVQIVLDPAVGDGFTALQREVQATLDAPLDEAELQSWWNATDDAKLARLLVLASEAPHLVPPELAAARLCDVRLERALSLGQAARLLAIEQRAGTLARRATQTRVLARAARQEPPLRRLLLEAARVGTLGAEWVWAYLDEADAAEVVGLAPAILTTYEHWPAEIVERLLALLAPIEPLPAQVQDAVREAGERLDGARDWRLGLALAHLLAPGDANAPARAVLDGLPRLDPASRGELVARVLSGACRGVPPRALVVNGCLRDPSLRDQATRLVRHPDVGDSLATLEILELGARLPAADEEALRALFAQLDAHVRRDADAATEAFVRRGWWSAWRAHTRLDAADRRRAALAWLHSSVWRRPGAPPAPLEAWRRVLADAGDLRGAEVAELCVKPGDTRLASGAALGRTWPLIPPFESDQLDDLCARVGFGGLAEIALALGPQDVGAELASDWESDLAARWLRRASADQARDTERVALALRWLMGHSAATLDLDESSWLCSQAEHREEQALAARDASVLAWLERDLRKSVSAASEPRLWQRSSFVDGLAQGLKRRPVLEQLAADVAKQIEEQMLDGPPEPRRVSDPPLADTLWDADLHNLARWTDPTVEARMNTRALPGRIVAALLAGRGVDAAWGELKSRFTDEGRTLVDTIVTELISQPAFQPSAVVETTAWRALAGAFWCHPELLLPQATGDGRVVPILRLAVALLGLGTAGLACQRLAALELPRGHDRTLHNVGWWSALLATAECARSPAEPAGTAPALVEQIMWTLEAPVREAAGAALDAWLSTTRVARD